MQLVEYYQKILVAYLDHSGNEVGGSWTKFLGEFVSFEALISKRINVNFFLSECESVVSKTHNLIFHKVLGYPVLEKPIIKVWIM